MSIRIKTSVFLTKLPFFEGYDDELYERINYCNVLIKTIHVLIKTIHVLIKTIHVFIKTISISRLVANLCLNLPMEHSYL